MSTLKIDGNEYELKLNYGAVKLLSNSFEGGAYEVIGKALSSDLDAFPKVLHAALFHTGKNFSLKKVEQAIEQAIDNEELSFESIGKILDEVVSQSFFFKATVDKMLEKNPEMAEAMAQIRG